MNQLCVSFEGGPIIVGAPKRLASWQGIEASDYANLCAVFDAKPANKVQALPGHEMNCIAVDFGGAGTVRVYSNDKGLILVRAWHTDPDADAIYDEALGLGHSGGDGGELDHDSDTVAIAWAAESLVGLPENVGEPTRPEMDLSLEDSVLLLPLTKGKYRWRRAEFDLLSGSVVRLCLERFQPRG